MVQSCSVRMVEERLRFRIPADTFEDRLSSIEPAAGFGESAQARAEREAYRRTGRNRDCVGAPGDGGVVGLGVPPQRALQIAAHVTKIAVVETGLGLERLQA